MKKSTARIRALIDVYKQLRYTYISTYELISTARDELRTNAFTPAEQVNIIYVLREMARYCDDLRKEVEGVCKLFENVCCAVYLSANNVDPIRAPLATGSPDMSLGPRLPSPNEPAQFAALMQYAGIKPEQADVVNINWSGIRNRINELMASGVALPPGLRDVKTFPIYRVVIRPVCNLDELCRQLEAAESEDACEKLLTERLK